MSPYEADGRQYHQFIHDGNLTKTEINLKKKGADCELSWIQL